jgi:hypothetical protein
VQNKKVDGVLPLSVVVRKLDKSFFYIYLFNFSSAFRNNNNNNKRPENKEKDHLFMFPPTKRDMIKFFTNRKYQIRKNREMDDIKIFSPKTEDAKACYR